MFTIRSHPIPPVGKRQSRCCIFSFIFKICIVLTLTSGCSVRTSTKDQTIIKTPSATEVMSPKEQVEKGYRAFLRGDFEVAISNWEEASRLYELQGKPAEQIRVLIKLSGAYGSIGEYDDALETLESAQLLAQSLGDRKLVATVLGSLGNVYIALGPSHLADQYLNEGLTMARELHNSSLTAVILNNLGNLYSLQKEYKAAIDAYTESKELAYAMGNHTLAVTALTNAAMASIQDEEYGKAKALLDKASDQIQSLDQSQDKIFRLINIGLAYQSLRPYLVESDVDLLHSAYMALIEAVDLAETIDNPRTASYAYGYLGKLHEDEHRYQEALQLTNRAIFAAQQVKAPASLYKWQWQAGRLLNKLGKIDEAISVYKRAVYTVQSIRQEMTRCYGRTQLSFRESVGPMYLELVDLLLHRADALHESEEYDTYLFEAREAVEVQKVFELREYFQDDCVGAAQTGIKTLDIVSQTAVVVYPVLLPDRTEILVSLPTGLKKFSVRIQGDTINKEAIEFRKKLEKRTTREFLPHAQKLYDWLIRPIEPDLASINIDTLVFVPDGPLRTVPMAALHDGEQFLINKYAVAVTPGLSLTDPRPISGEALNILLVGLTESTQGFPPLPHVSSELQTIQSLYPSKLLVNEEFSTSSVKKALADEQFAVVHIASHAQFDNDIEKTFLLTFDDKVTMDRLEQYVGLLRFREEPLELLTLSACDTATGDDRAALGLAGVAVKAGARSALATLWHINDLATASLVGEFYRQLQEPGGSKAVALQRAQLKMLNDRRYEHPGYWSPFLLINNWL